VKMLEDYAKTITLTVKEGLLDPVNGWLPITLCLCLCHDDAGLLRQPGMLLIVGLLFCVFSEFFWLCVVICFYVSPILLRASTTRGILQCLGCLT
jgi:hypothetical protein